MKHLALLLLLGACTPEIDPLATEPSSATPPPTPSLDVRFDGFEATLQHGFVCPHDDGCDDLLPRGFQEQTIRMAYELTAGDVLLDVGAERVGVRLEGAVLTPSSS